jgi:hypothetical protein
MDSAFDAAPDIGEPPLCASVRNWCDVRWRTDGVMAID